MGFNFYNLGCLNPCRIEHGNIIVHYLSLNKDVIYPSTLDVTIPEQSNFFISETVLFYLKHEGKHYFGRSDGRISIYDDDDLLLGIQSWEAPKKPYLCEVGYWRDVYKSGPILMPTTGEVAYAAGFHAEADMRKYNLDLTVNDPFDLDYSTVAIGMSAKNFAMFVEGGEDYGLVPWIVQTESWESNISNFL